MGPPPTRVLGWFTSGTTVTTLLRPCPVGLVAPLAFVCAPLARACDTGGCPLLTQSQDSVRTKGSFGIDVWFRTMRHDRYVGRIGAEGLTTLSLVPGVRLSVTARSVLYTYLKLPIATSTGGAPLAPTLDFAVGVGTRF